MATWKKILREDYAVGTTDGLVTFESAAAGQVLTLKLEDNRDTTTEGQGLESVALTFSSAFTVGANSISFPTLSFSDGTNTITRLDVATNESVIFGSSDSSIVVTANDGDGTIDLTAATSTITGNVDGNDGDSDPDSVTFNLGDGITFTSDSLDIFVSEASDVITIDLEVGTTTITGTIDSSFENYTAGTDNITFASYTTAAIGVVSNVSGTTVQLGVPDEDIEDLVGAMVTGSTQHGITVTYVDNGTSAGKINFDLNDLSFTGNTGAGAAIDYSSGSTLSVVGGANSGITVNAAGTTLTIDQSDVTITGTTASGSLTPTSGITFISTDNSVTSSISGGGDGAAVTVDLEATPQVTDIDVATDGSATYNITMTSATQTGDYAAFMDNGKLQWQVVDSGGSESGTLIVNGDMTVTGTTTTLQTANVIVEDKNIILANPDAAFATDDTGAGLANTAADGGGITLISHHGTNEAHFAGITWSPSSQLTGWRARDTSDFSSATDVAQANYPLAVMEFASNDAPTASDNSAGVGSFYMDTNTKILYLRTA